MDRIIRPPSSRRVRAGGLGQFDDEQNYGPSPIDIADVPVDLLPRLIRTGQGPGSAYPGGGAGLDPNALLAQIARDTNAIASTLTLDRGLLGRVVTVTTTPQLIINAQFPRPYLLLNPASVTGLTATSTIFPSTTLIGATTLTSGVLGVANYLTSRFFVTATFGAGVGPVTFDLQSKDPVTGTFITAQTIFSLAATGNSYASVGQLGVDTDYQVLVTVPVGTTITFTLGCVLKDGLEGTSSGSSQTIFIGGPGVSSIAGYPILNGKEKAFFFRENVNLYAVTAVGSLPLRIFEL